MMLPTFRRKVLASFLVVVGIFTVLGLVMIGVLGASGSIAPTLVHLNYDSIEAADQMIEAWSARRDPVGFPHLPPAAAAAQFERALAFEESNITEPGERELAQSLRVLWNGSRRSPAPVSAADFRTVHQLLKHLVAINESGMFGRVVAAKRLNRAATFTALAVLLAVLVGSVYLSDNLATRLSAPLRGMAAALHARPTLDKKLKLPTPTTIELRILIKELRRLWDSLAAANQVNVAEIVAQKSKLETLFSAVEDAFLVLDPRHVVTHCNDLLARIVGLPAVAIIGKTWTDLSTASANYLRLRSLIDEAGEREVEAALAVDEKTHNFLVRCRRIRGPKDQAVGSIILLRDVTERRQRDRLKSELLDLLSHELKTPIQSLGMAAEMLARNKPGMAENLRFFVDTINEDVLRIRAVAQQFIRASQSQAKSLRLDLRRVALSDEINNWLKPFEVLAGAKGVTIDYQVIGGTPVWAAVDSVKLPWAISNLLSNAIRVSPVDGVVGVRVGQRGDRIVVEVSDTGPGVTPAVERRMYEPFYQGPLDTSDPVERGLLGVGLTIAKEVVEGHDGRLEYAANTPHGATFRISLPALPAMDG